MKTIKTLILVMMALVGLVACKNDEQELAFALEGSWTGTVTTYNQDRWGTTTSTHTLAWTFHRNSNDDMDIYNSTSGWGNEVVYTESGRKDHYYEFKTPFTWHIEANPDNYKKSIIYINYDDKYGFDDIMIERYSIHGDTFTGWLYDGDNQGVEFSFKRDSSFDDTSDWRPRNK